MHAVTKIIARHALHVEAEAGEILDLIEGMLGNEINCFPTRIPRMAEDSLRLMQEDGAAT